MSQEEVDKVEGALRLQLEEAPVAVNGRLGVLFGKGLGPVQVVPPNDTVLGRWQTMQGPVIALSRHCDSLLSRQELGIVEPYLGHHVHVDESPFVQVIDHFVVLRLAQQVELLDVEARLFEEIEPQLVAAWQVGQSTLVETGSLLKVF